MPISLPQPLSFKKIASTLFILVFLSNLVLAFALLPTQQAKAQMYVEAPMTDLLIEKKTVIDQLWETIDKAIQKVTSVFSGLSAVTDLWKKADEVAGRLIRAALLVMLHRILGMITNEIIKWINGGGEPKFVSDWGAFLRDAANQAGGEFLGTLSGGFLCNPFAFQIRLALMPVPYYQQARCTLDMIKGNLAAFFGNFSAGGGWPMWLQVIQPNNNFYGSYLMALDEKDKWSMAAAEKAKNEAMSGGGFLSDKRCVNGGLINSNTGRMEEKCKGPSECEKMKEGMEGVSGQYEFKCSQEAIVTPASVAQYEVQQAVDSARSLLQQQIAALTPSLGVVTPYVTSIANALINRVIMTGLGAVAEAVAGGDESFGPTFSNPDYSLPPADPSTGDMDFSGVDALSDTLASAPGMIAAEELLKENMQAKLTEQQESLAVLASTKDKQLQTLGLLKDIVADNCSLPSGVSSEILSDTGSVQTIRLTASNAGSVTLRKTYFSDDFGDSTTIEILETLPAVAPQLTAMETAMASTQQTIVDIDTAISANRIAMEDADAYQELSEDSFSLSSAALEAAGEKLQASYDTAIIANKKATGSPETSLTLILQDVQEQNIATIEEINQIESARDSLNSQLSAASSQTSEAQNALNTCQTQGL